MTLGMGLLIDSENRHFQQLQAAIGADVNGAGPCVRALGQPPAAAEVRVRAGLRLYRATAALLKPQILPAHTPVVNETLARIEAALS